MTLDRRDASRSSRAARSRIDTKSLVDAHGWDADVHGISSDLHMTPLEIAPGGGGEAAGAAARSTTA